MATPMKYLSVCSGIEAATVAWRPLGWEAVGFSEIEPFPCAVLASHYPDVTNYGDLTKHETWNIEPGTVDVLIGGTPCQSFSVAGLRKGMADPRGNLVLVYLALVGRIRPRWVVWENVPGVLSSNGGKDFGAFIGALGELGYGFAYRVLDAQYWGVAQRRRRVFVVGCLGGWQRAASVLFERESCTRNTPARGKEGEGIAADVANGIKACGTGTARIGDITGQGNTTICFEPGAASRLGGSCWNEIAPTLRRSPGDNLPAIASMAHGQANAEVVTTSVAPTQSCNHEAPIVAGYYESHPQDSRVSGPHEMPGTVSAKHGTGGGNTPWVVPTELVSLSVCDDGRDVTVNQCPTLRKSVRMGVTSMGAVRRLTPRECERLQGFPDEYTNIDFSKIRPDVIQYLANVLGVKTSKILSKTLKPAADGSRYKALGNSMAVPVIRWIGERIQAVEELTSENNS